MNRENIRKEDMMARMWQALKAACDDPATLAVTVPSIKADLNLLHTCKWKHAKVGDPWYSTEEWESTCGECDEEPSDWWTYCPYCGEKIEVEW